MDMNKAYVLKKEACAPQWHVIDATDKVLGRLATQIAFMLRGKDRSSFTPYVDGGDYVVIINCEKIKLTGNKWKDKIYKRYSGWRSGIKETTAEQMREKKPEDLLHLAVWGMMPKNTLSHSLVKKLKVYAGPHHPHQAQIETTLQQGSTKAALPKGIRVGPKPVESDEIALVTPKAKTAKAKTSASKISDVKKVTKKIVGTKKFTK
jgi:large subunit ribosomal protein L13